MSQRVLTRAWYRYTVRGVIRPVPFLLAALLGSPLALLEAQVPYQQSVMQQIQQLTISMERSQTQIEESQRQLDTMRRQLANLQQQVAAGSSSPATPALAAKIPPPSSSSVSPDSTSATAPTTADLSDRQAMQQNQIATLDQIKVESESKYPVKISGLLLFNSFVNTSAVDMAPAPTIAIGGPGNTGASVRQTILGVDAHGPHLFGAASHADLSIDFDGMPQSSGGGSSTAYSTTFSSNATLLRLRTVHASLQWARTEAFFSLDRPIFSPDTPTSLTALANPALAWSGSLWSWNPQAGLTQELPLGGGRKFQMQAALIDVGDAPVTSWSTSVVQTGAPPTTAEQSRWPGGEVHISLLGTGSDDSEHFGLGGYVAPHISLTGQRFNAWASTMDYRLHLPSHFELTGSAYYGEALGGLGEGEYKDYVTRLDTDGAGYYFRTLDDIGGWVQLKQKTSERLQFNAALGLDQVFANQLRRYYTNTPGSIYQNLARNRTFTGNVIYSPSAYLLFSLEYRRLDSAPVNGQPWGSNVFGFAAAYKF